MELKINYIRALTNLYGHVEPAKVCEIYNQQNDEMKDPNEFEVFLKELKEVIENRFVYIKEDKFLDEVYYLSRVKYEALCAKQDGKPHYVPEKEELLNYVNPLYWEKPLVFEELEEYLLNQLFPEDEVTGRTLANEILTYMIEDKFDATLQLLHHYEVVFDEDKAVDELLNILQRLNNNTRMRVHNAFTPIEISQLTGESVYILPDKLLEDDNDCHCGSKKKYFDCHKEADSKIRRLSEYRKEMKEV